MTTETALAETRRNEQPSRLVRDHVLHVIRRLQTGYLPSGGGAATSRSVQTLAVLRRALGSAGESDPRSWSLVLEDLPMSLMGARDGWLTDPTPAERAVFTALTTYAVHQQSVRRPMHVDRVGLGRATRWLAQQRSRTEGGLDGATVDRMHKVSMAHTPELRSYALRSLVTLMKRAERPVGMDYGRLAEDLFWLDDPRYAHKVHLSWGRDLHARDATRETTDSTTETTTDTGATA